ncbi:MAG: uroporphyrinogen decarboxylase family protein [Thermodesulfobacteriota bacterium]
MSIATPFKQGADFESLRRVLLREGPPGPVPIIELMVDGDAMAKVTGLPTPISSMMDLMDFIEADGTVSQESLEKGMQLMDLSLKFARDVGYDYVTTIPVVPLPRTKLRQSRTVNGKAFTRSWQNEHEGLIRDRADFDAFPWPSVDSIDLITLDYLAPQLPEGSKIILFYFGIFEDLRALMGFENMAVKSIREPDLIADVLEKLTVLAEATMDRAMAHPAAGAVFYADDMGFNTGTMLSPKFFRQMVIPRLKRIADQSHRHGKPFLLHSCGQVDALMEDFIETVGIDGIHSFEDNIEPVESVYRRYHPRLSILGGVDVNLLANGTEEQVRKRCREILDVCGPKGGFAIGSGNSVTNYCKIENYYAMLDETRKWNRDNGF